MTKTILSETITEDFFFFKLQQVSSMFVTLLKMDNKLEHFLLMGARTMHESILKYKLCRSPLAFHYKSRIWNHTVVPEDYFSFPQVLMRTMWVKHEYLVLFCFLKNQHWRTDPLRPFGTHIWYLGITGGKIQIYPMLYISSADFIFVVNKLHIHGSLLNVV